MTNLSNLISSLKRSSKFEILFLLILSLWCMSIPFDNAIYQTTWTSLCVLFVYHVYYYKNIKIVKDILRALMPIAILFLCFWVSMLVSNSLNQAVLSKYSWKISIDFLFRFGVVFLAICYFYKINLFKDKILINSYIFGVCILGATGIIQLIFGDAITEGITGVLRNRNGFGLSIGIGLVMIAVFIENKILKNALLTIFIILVALSLSRSSWVGSFIALSFYILINLKQIKKRDILFALAIFIVFVAIYSMSESLQNRFLQLINGESSHRFGIWAYSIEKIMQQPIFGYGIDSFQHLPNAPFLTNPNYSAPHNMILDILFNTGFIGFFFFIGINLYIFLILIRTRNYKVMSVFIYIFTACQFDFGVFGSKELLSVVVVLSFLALKQKVKN